MSDKPLKFLGDNPEEKETKYPGPDATENKPEQLPSVWVSRAGRSKEIQQSEVLEAIANGWKVKGEK